MKAQFYRPEIDGIRALAVLAVVGYHYSLVNSIMGNGFIGVDIFFVISGFLITRSLAQSIDGGGYWLREFYFRRIRRIFPALIIVLLGTLLAGLVILLPFELRQLGKQIFFGALFSSNFHFWAESGYFDPESIQKPLLHLWSLGVEEQFYIFYPIFILVAIRFKIDLVKVAIGISFFSALFLIYLGVSSPAATYFSPLTRMWELSIGGIASSVVVEKSLRLHKFLRLIGVTLFLSAFHFTNVGSSYPNWSTLLPVVGTALILVFVRDEGFVSIILRNRVLTWIGRMSYSLYLWHWPVISLYVISEGHLPNRQVKYVLFALSLFLSLITFKLIELPSRNFALSAKNVSLIFGSLMAVGIFGGVISNGDGYPSRIPSKNGSLVSLEDVSNQFKTVDFSNPECLENYPNEKAKSYKWWFCRSNNSNPPEILLWGNSYANQYFSGLSSNPYSGQISLLSIGDCPIQREMELLPPNPCAGALFDEQRAFIKALITKKKSIRLVILAGLKEEADSQSMQDLSDAIEFLQSMQVRVVVFYPHIKPPKPIFGCISRPLRPENWYCRLGPSD
ncbi:MAG: acyltransferase family protein, partial [Proteobacteria bacterium]|nr:acyltransferase family protein [Pseudomonadota bacterium]